MKADILDKSEEHLWEDFIKDHHLASIHQIPKWGHFQAKIASRGKYWIVVIKEDGKIIGGTLLIRYQLPRGYSWLYAPRGPLVDYQKPEQLQVLTEAIEGIAKEEKSIFLRIDPPLKQSCKIANFKATKNGFQPEHTIILDISLPQDEILAQMKPKGRYNIKVAEKKGVQVRKADPANPEQFAKELDDFFEILEETTKRDRFYSHDQAYYQKMLTNLDENASLYIAHFQNHPVAAILVTYFNGTATYYYGASSNLHRNVMASYLLHWHAIKDAKKIGCKKYDLFGIAPPEAKNHPWQGVTQFKNKFGGHRRSYPPAQEHSFKKLIYFLYFLYKRLKK